MSRTYNHQCKLKAFFHGLSVHLIGKVGKSHISCSIRKLETHNIRTVTPMNKFNAETFNMLIYSAPKGIANESITIVIVKIIIISPNTPFLF